MIDPAIFEHLQTKIDEETAVRDVSRTFFSSLTALELWLHEIHGLGLLGAS
jgi:hypothetical protein